ncbi:MAG: hypothetical protein AMJ61_12125 [Desulfobacterales bacterium SG8_35_2]|nr:MAG: hypothetical protein AMJ61_12125 [Desulfobacterales bacterium SG8_35_2]
MFKFLKQLLYFCVICLLAVSFIYCSNSGTPTGTLGVGLTDDSTDLYQAIYVTIDEVQIKKQEKDEGESGWLPVLSPQQTFNLLELVNGVIADLGLVELEAGDYGQMRLILGKQSDDSENILGEAHLFPNYLIKNDPDNTIEELKVSSGFQTGIKIIQGFTIVASGATEIILDFDACKSVVQAGDSGQWLLKPTVRVSETLTNSVSGVVTDNTDFPLEGALVSAQIYSPPPGALDGWDPKNEVMNEGGTSSNITGDYILFLPPRTYNIVATMNGYTPQCQVVAATDYQEYPDINFTLTALAAENSGTITGSVGGVESAEFSIRQIVDCGSGNVLIEVASVSVADGATSDPITLPAGIYEVVISPAGLETYVLEGGIEVVAGDTLDIVYPPLP